MLSDICNRKAYVDRLRCLMLYMYIAFAHSMGGTVYGIILCVFAWLLIGVADADNDFIIYFCIL